jgi:hypothetical protein
MGRLVVPKGEAGYLTRFERFNSDMMFSTTLQSKHCDGVTYPVALRKHGYVTRVADWQYSTFHRDVKAGLYPESWGGGDISTFEPTDFGE